MCISVFLWQEHPDPLYQFLLLLNRDEYHNRPTKPLAWWEGGEILGGRDEVAGGTWLACNRDGRLAFVTNVREIPPLSEPKSRGDLPVRFLKSKKNPKDFAEEIAKEADQYNGFNLIVVDICSKTMVYISNRSKEDAVSIIEVSPGIHVLTNHSLDSPWPKAERLRCSFMEQLDKYGEAEMPMKELVDKLMRNTIKEEKCLPSIHSPEWEYQLSSIFVEADTPLGRYGTRSTSAISVTASGEVSFYQSSLEEEMWKEHTVNYQIEKAHS